MSTQDFEPDFPVSDMTLQDYFAGLALQSLLLHPGNLGLEDSEISEQAFDLATQMLASRKLRTSSHGEPIVKCLNFESRSSSWPEDNYDWPQTASTVQGGVVKDGDIKLTKDEILFLLKEVKRLGSEVEQIRRFALDVARHWYNGDWNDERKTAGLLDKLWEAVSVMGAAEA